MLILGKVQVSQIKFELDKDSSRIETIDYSSVRLSFASSWKELPANEKSFLADGNVWVLKLFLLFVEGGASKGRSAEVADSSS